MTQPMDKLFISSSSENFAY